MYNRQLDTFLKVAETGSFSAAASELYISSSAVIQQINILEKNLGVTLFERSKRGVTTTEAGEYLVAQARDIIYRSAKIRQHLMEIDTRHDSICVGTSLMEKCRVLYDLWVLFSQEKHNNYEVRLVSINTGLLDLEEAELVECVRDNAPWQHGWNFLEFCRIPFGCAVAADHPLAEKDHFTYEDLRGQEVILLNRGNVAQGRALEQDLEAHGARVIQHQECSGGLIWECSIKKQIMVVPCCWDDVLFDLNVKPCNWHYTIPYGLFYRPDCSPQLREFLSFVRGLVDSNRLSGFLKNLQV